MTKRYMVASLAACLVGYTAGASAMDPAAVVRQPLGKVFVSQGKAMTLAQEGMPLYTGNRVITVSGGRAEVAYSDGCVLALPENSLLAVKGANQCQRGQAQVRATSSFQSARIGQAGSTDEVAKIGKVEGAGFVGRSPAEPGMLLFKGNLVRAGANGKLVIKYSNGCETTVEANQSLEIGDPPNCRAAGADDSGGVAPIGVAGAGGGGAGAGVGVGVGAGVGAGLGTGGLIVAGALGAGVIAAAAKTGDDDPESPANPSN